MSLVPGIPVPVDSLFFSYWMPKMESVGGSALVYLQVVSNVCRDKNDPNFGWAMIKSSEIGDMTGMTQRQVRRCLNFLEGDLRVLREKSIGNCKYYLPLQLPQPKNIEESTQEDIEEALALWPKDERLQFLFKDTESVGKRKKKTKKKTNRKIRYRLHPSLRPDYTKWKAKKKTPSGWRPTEFLGYYLHLYKLQYGMEDPDFKTSVNQASNDLLEKYAKDPTKLTANEKERIEKDRTSVWKLAKYKIGSFSRHFFYGDKDEFKQYIDWVFDYIDKEESDWFDNTLSHHIIFKEKNNPFLKKYIATKKRRRKGKKKKWSNSDWADRHK